MKKVFFYALMVAACVSSCANSGKAAAEGADVVKAEAEASQAAAEQTVAQVNEAVAGVVNLADDNAYRPDTKVSELTVLDFNATWCGPCKMLAPVFDATAEKFAGKVKFVSVDVDNCPETAAAFAIRAVPTVVLLKADGGSLRYEGTQDLLPAEKLEKIISDNL